MVLLNNVSTENFAGISYKLNNEKNGVEIYFTDKPASEVRNELKANGFRWSSYNGCWYARQNEKTIQVAKNFSNNIVEVTPETKQPKQTKKAATILNLWDATQFEGLSLTMEQKEQECKVIAKEIRSHIKKRFPNCKFSVTVPYYGKINFEIKSSPYEKGSVYLKAIQSYCEKLLNAYKHTYSAPDHYSDYAGSYNFYGWVNVAYDYVQTEVNEDVKNDMLLFDAKMNEFEQLEEERKQLEYQEYLKEQEARNAEYKKQKEAEQKQIEEIYNSVEVKEIEEDEQYFVIGSEFADLNKNNTLDQYIDEVAKGDYTLQNVKITKELHFNNFEALENFSNMLLTDFDFLTNTGGSYTDDNRINSMTDFYNMDEAERQTVQWNLYGVAIYFENELQFVVDAQGYSYARYVGLVDNAKIEKSIVVNQVLTESEIQELKYQADVLECISVEVIEELNIMESWNNDNWEQYKNAMKVQLKDCEFKLNKGIIQQLEIEELKVAMYKLLVEVDGIQDQFAEANIKQGEKLTLFYISDFGSIVESRVVFDSVTNTKYAQYDKAVKLTYTPEGKRKMYSSYFYSTLLVYKGWHTLPKTVLHEIEESNGMIVTRTKYHSCNHKQYDEILTHFEQLGIKPIVNTYKPIF